MKNKFAKTILISFLCLIIFAGCSVVPSSTPETTPTPIEPTPTPIPYGEVVDVVIETNDNIFFNWNIAQILLEKFSIRLIEYNPYTTTGYDVRVYAEDRSPSYNEGTVADYSERRARRRAVVSNNFDINYLERLKDMPNYSSLLYSKEMVYALFPDDHYGSRYSLPLTGRETSSYYLWLYNEKWFEKYNYSIPETMEELVDLLIYHKANVDPSAQPILTNNFGYKGPYKSTIMETTLPYGVFASYGIDYLNELKKVGEDEFNYSTSDPNVIGALDILKKINDNSLAGDLVLDYDNVSGSDFSECAVFYFTREAHDYQINDNNTVNWKTVETQFSYDGTPYVVHNDINYASTDLNYFSIYKYAKKEIINRLLDYIDWCSTDEGVLASRFGIEGTDYKIDENGKLILLKEFEEISPAAMQVVTGKYISNIARKYGYTSNSSLPKIDEDKNNIKILTQPEIKYASSSNGKDAYNNLVAVSKQFFNDYINGIKTAEDFEEYITDLEEAGLSDFLEDAKEYYDDLYEEFKDYLPDSLK